MRLTAHWILLLATAALVMGCCCCECKKEDDPQDVPLARDVSISRFHTSSLTDADADRILAEANSVLEEINGPGDVNCTIGLRRAGPVTTFTTGDGQINTQAEYNQIMALPGDIKVVDAINWCTDPGAFIIGCASVPGNSLIVVRPDDSSNRQEGILWAHEYGHNCGLHHRDGADNEVMNGTISGAHTFVNQSEKDAYQRNQAAIQPGSGGPATAATTTAPAGAAAGPGDVKAFVRKRYIEGVPPQKAAAFGPAHVPVLIQMLNDPAEAKWRPNIVTVLGIIGDARAVDPLIKVVQEGQGVLSRVEYGAKQGAIMFLGDVINAGDPKDPAIIKALDYLTQGAVNPAIWSQRVQWTSPFTQDPTVRNWQLTKAAIWALAMTGKQEAADAIDELAAKIQPTTAPVAPPMDQVPADLKDLIKEAKAALAVVRKDGLRKYRMQMHHRS